MRKLVHDGAPSRNIAGADISRPFVEYGYEYFRDKEKLHSKFIVGDVLDETSPAFLEAEKSFDIVFASMFYHLWGWKDHIKTLARTIKLLKPISGSTLFGWQLGASPAVEINRNLYQNRLSQHKLMYLHDENSWKKMWAEVESQTDTKWYVEAKAVVTPEITQRQQEMPHPEGTTLHAIFFIMTRI
jgi:SAM-dependent methyltransferase